MIPNSIRCFLFKQKHSLKCFKNNTFKEQGLRFHKNATIFNCELNGDISIDDGCIINNSILRGNISIGKYSSINGPTSFIVAKHNNISIGNYCSIAHNVNIIEFYHNSRTLSTSFLHKKITGMSSQNDTWSKGSINIGSDVWIGAGATILSGVNIGHGSIIGANSLVTKDVPDFAVMGGNPAHLIKYRFEKNIIEALLQLTWWEKDLSQLKNIQGLLNKNLDLQLLDELKLKL